MYYLLVLSLPFFKLIVPTVDTVRYNFLVSNLIKALCPVMLVGPVGTGKTSVVENVLQKLDNRTYSVLTVNMSAQVRKSFQIFIQIIEVIITDFNTKINDTI